MSRVEVDVVAGFQLDVDLESSSLTTGGKSAGRRPGKGRLSV